MQRRVKARREKWEKRWGGQFDLLKVLIEPLLEVEATASGKKEEKTLQRLEDAIGEGSVVGGLGGRDFCFFDADHCSEHGDQGEGWYQGKG